LLRCTLRRGAAEAAAIDADALGGLARDRLRWITAATRTATRSVGVVSTARCGCRQNLRSSSARMRCVASHIHIDIFDADAADVTSEPQRSLGPVPKGPLVDVRHRLPGRIT